MSQASTTLTGQDYFLGSTSVVRLANKQYFALKREGIVNVENLKEFKVDDVDNVVHYFKRPQDIWYPMVQAHAGSVEAFENLAAIPPVAYQATVAQRDRVNT